MTPRPLAREMAQAGGGLSTAQANAIRRRSSQARRALARAIVQANPSRYRR